MTNLELVLNMLAEVTTTEISKVKNPKDFYENKEVARKGGGTANVARKDIEKKIGESVISSKNAKYLKNKQGKRLKEEVKDIPDIL